MWHQNSGNYSLLCRGTLYHYRSSPGDSLFDGRLLYNRWIGLDSVCRRLLGLTPAIQRYRIRLCRIKTQEFAVFCGEDLYSTSSLDILYSTAEYSTTAGPTLALFAGGCWARRRLPNSIRYVSVASDLMNPPTLLRVVLLKVHALDGRSLHNC